MECSGVIDSNQAVLSPDGTLLLSVFNATLEVRRIWSLEIIRSIPLSTQTAKPPTLHWAPVVHNAGSPSRFLVADDKSVKVYDLDDEDWLASIDLSNSDGTMAHVDFGGHDGEVMVYSPFNAALTICDLWSRNQTVIQNPKFFVKGQGRHKNFAVLTRQETQDIVTIHAHSTYNTLATIKTPTTDAQGLKWSPDGNWLVVWDAAAFGYRVFIYTADGQLYRKYTGDNFEDELQGLGVKSIEWSPDGHFLAVSGHDNIVKLLSTKTMTTAIELAHSPSVRPSQTPIHIEQASSQVGRQYTLSGCQTFLPTSEKPALGVSAMSFNADGTLLATKHDYYPSTVWIWDLAALQPRAVLVQHSNVKRFTWHYGNATCLLIESFQDEPVVHLWQGDAGPSLQVSEPAAIEVPNSFGLSSKGESSWLRMPNHSEALFYQEDERCSVLWPFGRPPSSPSFADAHDDSMVENGDLGKSALQQDFEALNGSTHDTFQFRRGVSAY